MYVPEACFAFIRSRYLTEIWRNLNICQVLKIVGIIIKNGNHVLSSKTLHATLPRNQAHIFFFCIIKTTSRHLTSDSLEKFQHFLIELPIRKYVDSRRFVDISYSSFYLASDRTVATSLSVIPCHLE